MWCTCSNFEHHFGSLRTASIADHTLVCMIALFTFFLLHTFSSEKGFNNFFGRPICCAAENWYAAIQFYSMQQLLEPLLNLKMLSPESEHFEEHIIVTNCIHWEGEKFQNAFLSSYRAKTWCRVCSHLFKGVFWTFLRRTELGQLRCLKRRLHCTGFQSNISQEPCNGCNILLL